MKKFLLLSCFLIACSSFYAKEAKHKVDVKDDTVIVDEKPLFILEKFKASLGVVNYYVKDLSGKKLVFLQSNSYKDPKEISNANPDGKVSYFELTFLEDEAKAEIPMYARQSKVAEYLVKMELMDNGKLTEESEKEFILVTGQPYSRKRQELGGSGTIIINNSNTSPPPQRNGINVHIGN